MNREAWLLKATEKLRKGIFTDALAHIPDVKISVGFPGGGVRRTTIGQFWRAEATQDKIPQIYISPVIDDPIRALDILVHELVHACTPGHGHKKPFGDLARAVGLTGKLTATVAGPELKDKLVDLSASLGKFPHAAITMSEVKKQPTALRKVECSNCGYVLRTTDKWLNLWGAPICPCNNERMNEV